MDKIPTALDILEKYGSSDAVNAMIEFTELHVKAALKEASKKVKTKIKMVSSSGSGYSKYKSKEVIDEKSIINAYPLSNIK